MRLDGSQCKPSSFGGLDYILEFVIHFPILKQHIDYDKQADNHERRKTRYQTQRERFASWFETVTQIKKAEKT